MVLTNEVFGPFLAFHAAHLCEFVLALFSPLAHSSSPNRKADAEETPSGGCFSFTKPPPSHAFSPRPAHSPEVPPANFVPLPLRSRPRGILGYVVFHEPGLLQAPGSAFRPRDAMTSHPSSSLPPSSSAPVSLSLRLRNSFYDTESQTQSRRQVHFSAK